MNKETMTIHKALSELKILDDRIEKTIEAQKLCVMNKHSNTKIDGVSIDEFCENVKSGYDKVVDLICRRKAIKRAVVLSNATTEVEIAGVKYTVAEAIEMKNHGIELDECFLGQMQSRYTNAMAIDAMKNGDSLTEKAENYVATVFGSKEKSNPEDFQRAMDDFIKNNAYDFIDPLGIKERMEEIEAYIDNFKSEVDSALSVSNAMTTIEVEY